VETLQLEENINYYKLNDQIFDQRLKIKDLEQEIKWLIKKSGPRDVQAQDYSTSGGGSGFKNVSELYRQIEEMSKQIQKERIRLNELLNLKTKVIKVLKCNLNKTERRVFMLSYIKEYTLVEIAIELDKNYSYIRRVSLNIDKKLKVVV
jgi:DNA-directed RNA polymerase specialized sigma subunit